MFIGDFLEGGGPANIGMVKIAFKIAREPIIQPLKARGTTAHAGTTLSKIMIDGR